MCWCFISSIFTEHLKNDAQTNSPMASWWCRWGWVCAVFLPYWLWTADDALHYVVSDLLSIILVNVEGKNYLSEGGFPILPVLAHHVLQVDGRWEAGACIRAELGIISNLVSDPISYTFINVYVCKSKSMGSEILNIRKIALPAWRTGNSTCSDMMIWSRVGAKLIIL